MSQSASKTHRVRAITFTVVPVPKQEIVVLAVVLGSHGLRSRWRAMRGHVCDHVVEVWQELRVEERQDFLVELARTPGGHHIMVTCVTRRPVPIE